MFRIDAAKNGLVGLALAEMLPLPQVFRQRDSAREGGGVHTSRGNDLEQLQPFNSISTYHGLWPSLQDLVGRWLFLHMITMRA